jgi:tetratricopeptide (TPR) repeat protein
VTVPDRRAVLLLLAASLLPYLNALPNEFTVDDFGLVVQNEAVATFDAVSFWSQDYWAGYDANARSGLYRPLTLTSFAAEYALFGLQPFPYHVTNLLLHLSVTLLAWRLFLRLVGAAPALWGAAVFAVLPGHSEAVIAVAGRADLLATAMILMALLVWTGGDGWRRVVSGAMCFGFGLLAKEQAALAPGLLLCVDWLWFRRHSRSWCWQPYAAAALMAAGYLWLRHGVMGGLTTMEIEPLDNPLVDLPGAERVLAALAVATRYAILLVLPARLSADYSYAAIEVDALHILEITGGLLLVLAVAATAWRFVRQPDPPGLAMVWLAVSFAPLVNVLFPIGTILAERISYTPSIGYALGVGWALDRARHRLGTRAARSLGLALLLVLAVRTTIRCADWRDELSLFTAVVEVYPDNAKGHKGLAKALKDAGRLAEAETHYREAIGIYPRFDTAHYNLGILLLETARADEALFHFERACALRPTFADAHLNRGVALFQLGRLSESREATLRAVELRPAWDVAQQNLQDVEGVIDQMEAAER